MLDILLIVYILESLKDVSERLRTVLIQTETIDVNFWKENMNKIFKVTKNNHSYR